MNVLLVYRNDEKEKYATEIAKIREYWESNDFHVIDLERTADNESKTGLATEDYDFDYMIVINTTGFSGESTGGLLSYNLITAIQIFMIYEGSDLVTYSEKEFALNQYVFVKKEFVETAQKNMLNVESLETYDFDVVQMFDYVRKDSLESITLPKKIRGSAGRYMKGLMRKAVIFERQQDAIRCAFAELNRDTSEKNRLVAFKEECDKIDSDMALYHMNIVIPLQKCIEILELEEKMGYPFFSCDCKNVMEMCEKYVFLTDVIRTLGWNPNEQMQAAALQWLMERHISPAAILIVIKTETVGEILSHYQRFAVFFRCQGDVKAEKVFMAYASGM